MSTDQTKICNMALALVGSRSTIANIQEQSKEAQALSVWYDPTREAVLRACHWDFARRQEALSLISSTNNSQAVPPPWVNEYMYPSDCIQMRYLLPQFQSVPGMLPGMPTMPEYIGPPVRFIIGNDKDQWGNDRRIILTNQDQSIGVYTKDVSNTGIFDPSFVEAFSFLLASRVCIQLTGDKSLAKVRFEHAVAVVNSAQARNGNEGLRVQDVATDWMRVRGYASDWAFPEGSMYFFGPQALTLIM